MDFINDSGFLSMGMMVAFIIALSQLFKELGVNSKYIPIINILLGIITCIAFTDTELNLKVLNGIIAGLTASGLFSGIKNVSQSIQEK